ncbi:anti-sigma regulatory factor [Oscillatoriales cyanobacterium USR001]|nr:anti-sigma regulatory factor [Oscillatoriales cyanobacterium USR001]
MKDDQLRVKSHLQVQTDLTALTVVLEWLEKIVLPLLPHHLWWECQLILNEGFTNAVRHAHQNLPPATPIDLEVKVFANSLEILIWDCGQPFNLEEKLQLILKQPSDPLESEGGRGLLFMQKLTDELSYIRTSDHRNCLVMRKSIIC